MALVAVPDAQLGAAQPPASDETVPALAQQRTLVARTQPRGPARRVRPSRRRRVVAFVAGGVAAVLVGGVVGYQVWSQGGDGRGAGPPTDEVTYPSGLAVAPDGSVYVCDSSRHRVIRVDTTGRVTLVAGGAKSGNSGDGGRAVDAGLDFPSDVALASDGTLYVASGGIVRRIGADGMIGPVSGFPDGFGALELAVAQDGRLYSADKHRIMVRSASGCVAALVDDDRIAAIEDIALHPDGWLAVSDPTQDQILRVTATGKVSRIAGLATPSNSPKGDGLPAGESAVPDPTGLAFDHDGRLYFSEAGNNRVRVLELDKTLRTVAGSPEGYSAGDTGDGGPGRSATFQLLGGSLAVDANANVYIADVSNQRVRRLDPAGAVHPFV